MNQSIETIKPSSFRVFLNRLWLWLVGAHPSIKEVGAARQAQLSAALSVAFGVLIAVGVFTSIAQQGFGNPALIYLAILTLVSFTAYGISRSRYYVIGAIILTGFLSLSGFGLVLGGSDDITSSLYSVIPLAFVIGSVLLTMRALVALVLLNLVGIFLLPMMAPNVPGQEIFSVAGVLISLGALVLIATGFRNAVERQRVEEVASINRELQALSSSLEQRVVDRTRDLALAAEVSRTISQVRDLNTLLAEAARLIRGRFNLYYTQLYLLDPTGRSLVLRAGTGTVGATLLQQGHRLPVDLASINGTVAVEKQPVIVADTATSSTFRLNPILPDTRSEMAVPLTIGERLLGVLDLQSSVPNSLSDENLPVFETLAGQLAITIENTNLFNETERARTEVEAQARRLTHEGWREFFNAIQRRERIGYAYEQDNLSPLMEPLAISQDRNILVASIDVAGEKIGALQFQGESPWMPDDIDLVNTIARQVAQQVENLRLLADAEQARAEAEEATRRLTREGWERFFETLAQQESGFVYDLETVQPMLTTSGITESFTALKELNVRDEPIGEISVAGVESLDETTKEMVAFIAEQLSAHLENLRLTEQTQQALVTSQDALAETRRAQEELLKFRLGIEQSTDAVFITDLDGTIIYTNTAFEKVYGYSPQDVIGENPRILESGETPQDQYEVFWQSLLNKQVVAGEFVNKHKDGRLIPIEGSYVPILDDAENILGFLALHRDISERKQAEETLTKRAQELARVAEMSTTVSTIMEPDKILQTVVDLTKENFNLYHAHIYLMDDRGETLNLVAGAGEVGRHMVAQKWQIPLDSERSLVAHAAREHQGIIVNDVRADPDFLPNELLPDTHSEMAVPLIAAGKVLGVIDVQSDEVNHFTQEDVNIQTTLASQVAVALQNAYTYAQTQRQAEYEALINAISQRIQSTTTVESALQVAIRELGRALGAKRTSVQLSLAKERNTRQAALSTQEG